MNNIDFDEAQIILSVIVKINQELERCYYNKYQREYNSPIYNNGSRYRNDTFELNAYYWGDDDAEIARPNFLYKGLQCYWYKHLYRCFVARCDEEVTLKYLAKMLKDCTNAIRRDFGEIVENEEEEAEEDSET